MVFLAFAPSVPAESLGDTEDPVERLASRIDTLRAAGEYEEALTAARELLQVVLDDPEARPFETADAERLLATLTRAVALPREERALLARADSLALAAQTLWADGRFAEGAILVSRELAIRRSVLGLEHPEVATTMNNLAALLAAQGKLSDAEELYNQALVLKRTLLGEEHPDVAFALNNLASLRYAQGDYEGAELLLREALDVLTVVYGESDPVTTACLLNLGAILRAEGKYAAAEPIYRQVLEARRSALREDDPDVAESMNALAGVLKARGDYAAAEPLYRAALAIRRRRLGPDHPAVARSLNDLAGLLYAQGAYASAEPLFREALSMRTAILGSNHPQVAQALNNLAACLYARGDYASAEPLYRRALAVRREVLGEEHPDVAVSIYNLGVLLKARGEYEEAEELFLEALQMRRRLFGEEHPDIAASLYNLGSLYYLRGEYDRAVQQYREALRMRRRFLGGGHPYVAETLHRLGMALKAQGNYGAAEPVLEEACAAYDAARLRAGAVTSRATFLACPYADLAEATLALGRNEEAWPAAEKALARTLVDLLMAAESRELTSEEAAREDSLRQELGRRERELATYREAAREDSSAEAAARVAAARGALLDVEAGWSAFRRRMATEYPVTEGRAVALDRVQSALGSGTAIIGWIDVEVGADTCESWGYVIRDTGSVFWTHLAQPRPRESVFGRIGAFRHELADPRSPRVGTIVDGSRVWRERMAPLAEALDGVEALIVIPSGAMLGVPVEPLVDDTGTFLVDKYAISYVPSATVFTWLTERAGEPGPRQGASALLLGDPPFTDAQLAEMAGADPPSDAGGGADRASPGWRLAMTALPRLPGTRSEVLGVAEVLDGATVLLGPDACEQALFRLVDSGRMADFDIIHLATHAHIDDEVPGRSALVLSQVDLPDQLDQALKGARIYDGFLSAKEIVREWKLDAGLVTLSACSTALGREAGGEGYIGFAQAFLRAGARSLLVSLWKVEDRATGLLMRRFYENMSRERGEGAGEAANPLSKAEALREAKRWLRSYVDEDGQRPFERPFYWSAFVLVGERG